MKVIRKSTGYTLIEMLIALLITGIITSAGFKFYVAMHNQTLAQEEISDMQQTSRACLDDICGTLRMAGYKVGAHAPYSISGDSLYIFFSETQPIDSVLYYLADYSDGDFQWLGSRPEGFAPKKLMKKVNGASAAIFADMIKGMRIVPLSASKLAVSLEVQASQPDEDYSPNNGYRTHVATETINLRNLAL